MSDSKRINTPESKKVLQDMNQKLGKMDHHHENHETQMLISKLLAE